MSDFAIILLSSSLILILFITFLTIIIALFINKNKNKNKTSNFQQITRKPYFINQNHDKEKWWVSNKGNLEKVWMKSQDYDYKIAYFDYYENFSKDFFNSKFIRTKSFLLEIMDLKSVNKTIKRLKTYNTCLENVWWKKYKILMQSSLQEMKELTLSPEYFFYRYYFKFIYELRELLSEYLCNYIIPNTIFMELKAIHYKRFNIKNIGDTKKTILFAFEQVAEEANKIADNLHDEFNNELNEKGSNWKVNYKNDLDLMNILKQDQYIQNLFLKEQVWKLTREFNLPKTNDLQDAIQNLENHIKNMQENKINSLQEYLDQFSNL